MKCLSGLMLLLLLLVVCSFDALAQNWKYEEQEEAYVLTSPPDDLVASINLGSKTCLIFRRWTKKRVEHVIYEVDSLGQISWIKNITLPDQALWLKSDGNDFYIACSDCQEKEQKSSVIYTFDNFWNFKHNISIKHPIGVELVDFLIDSTFVFFIEGGFDNDKVNLCRLTAKGILRKNYPNQIYNQLSAVEGNLWALTLDSIVHNTDDTMMIKEQTILLDNNFTVLSSTKEIGLVDRQLIAETAFYFQNGNIASFVYTQADISSNFSLYDSNKALLKKFPLPPKTICINKPQAIFNDCCIIQLRYKGAQTESIAQFDNQGHCKILVHFSEKQQLLQFAAFNQGKKVWYLYKSEEAKEPKFIFRVIDASS